MELDEVSVGRVAVVASPAEFVESLLEFREGANNLVGRKVDEDSGSSAGCGGCAWIRWLFVLEGFSGWVSDQPGHSILVENPHTRHSHTLFSVYD